MNEVFCWIKAFVLEVGALACIAVPCVAIVFGFFGIEKLAKRYLNKDGIGMAVAVLFVCGLLYGAVHATRLNKQGICERGLAGQWHHIWSDK